LGGGGVCGVPGPRPALVSPPPGGGGGGWQSDGYMMVCVAGNTGTSWTTVGVPRSRTGFNGVQRGNRIQCLTGVDWIRPEVAGEHTTRLSCVRDGAGSATHAAVLCAGCNAGKLVWVVSFIVVGVVLGVPLTWAALPDR
jgi:hypothetical protein